MERAVENSGTLKSKVLLRRIARSIPILPDRFFGGIFVADKGLDFLAVHVLDHVVGLPLLEAEADSFV